MKAAITATGTLILTPENGTEAYALHHWVERLTPPRAEDCKPGASVIQIDLSSFPETLRARFTEDDLEALRKGWGRASPGWGPP